MKKAGKRVAVVGAAADPHAGYVADAVERLGAKALRIDTSEGRLSWVGDGAVWAGNDLAAVRCYYVKSLHLSLPLFQPEGMPEEDDWAARYVAERERHSLVTSVFRSLHAQGRHMVNPVHHFDVHFLKLHQLELLRRAGLDVPASLATADGKQVRAFAKKHRGVIYKPLGGGALVRRLEARDLTDERLGLLETAPVLFQEEVEGDELRVYVLDGKVVGAFAAATDGVVDVREVLDRFAPVTLTKAEQSVCARAARALGLVFGAVDLRRSAKGRLSVLECNPAPAIAFHDDPRDGRVITALAKHLVEHA